ncbi:MAG: hypothetical protein ACR2LN_02365 [Candidatus Levyibacteriota bacterium]
MIEEQRNVIRHRELFSRPRTDDTGTNDARVRYHREVTPRPLETVKFLPVNIHPSQFMRPPTEPFSLSIEKESLTQEAEVNAAAAKYGHSLLPGIHPHPILEAGTELELLLFSSDSIPHLDITKDKKDNPNYSANHLKNVVKLMADLEKPSKEGGLEDLLYNDITNNRILSEIRIRPVDVGEYTLAMERIQAWFQENAPKYRINPTIFSQHLHLSLVDHKNGINLLQSYSGLRAVGKGILDINHRALPFILLPERVDSDRVISLMSGYGEAGVGLREDLRPVRVEARTLSSEYAWDPRINLYLHLIGLRRGLEYSSDIYKIDADYPLREDSNGNPYYDIGGSYNKSYEDSLGRILRDPVLTENIPKELLHGIHAAASLHPDISTGRMSVREVREKMHEAVHGFPEGEGVV